MLIKEILNRMIGKKVLVIGDVMLDKSIYYRTHSYSKEFDGDILVEKERINYPGGAANVAMQCRSLGAHVTLLGAFGTDQAGLRLHSGLTSALIRLPTSGWESRKYWRTTTKTRVFVNSTPKYRIDEDFHQNLSAQEVVSEMKKSKYDLLLLSDYSKGMFSDVNSTCTIIRSFASMYPQAIIAANPKPSIVCFLPYMDLISLNDEEYKQCYSLLGEDRFGMVLHTRGSHGVEVEFVGTKKTSVDGLPVLNPDVVGCGDAVFAAASLAYSIYPDPLVLGKIAVAAGTAKATKQGTARVLPSDIEELYSKVNDA